jgi:hypothetical protein
LIDGGERGGLGYVARIRVNLFFFYRVGILVLELVPLKRRIMREKKLRDSVSLGLLRLRDDI